MDFRALLLKLYFNVESAYYEFLDAIDNYIPIYKTLVNPIEDAGYPSFPVYCVLFIFILAVLFFFSAANIAPTSPLYLQVQTIAGAPLPGVVVIVGVVSASDGNGLVSNVASGTSDFSGRVGFVGIPVKQLRVTVEKAGYVSKTQQLEEFPLTLVTVALEPTPATSMQGQEASAAIQRLLEDIERLKREGYPEFAEATARANEISEQGLEDANQ